MQTNILNHALLSEVLRPQTLADLVLPDHLINPLEGCIRSRSIPNMLFHGEPGIGKTSAARILLRELDADFREFNGSFNDGDRTFVKTIKAFTRTTSLIGRPKVCFIDEADFMSRVVQDSLRHTIEEVSDNARFLLTANDESKLTPAMKSRCMPIWFGVLRKDKDAVIHRAVGRYETKLKSLGYDVPRERIEQIVSLHFPDFRAIVNNFQMEILQVV